MALRTAAPSALLLLAWLAQPATAQAQAAASPDSTAREAAAPATATTRAPESAEAPATPVKLPVDMARLQRRLQDSAERDASGGPRIRFDVSVYAAAPRIQIFTPEDNVKSGQPRWSAPSHQDMMNIVTPQPFRHMPGVGLGSIINWFGSEKR